MSENPYTKRVEEFKERAASGAQYVNQKAFFLDKTWFSGQEKGWNEGEQRYFNFDSENDCADAFYVYLSRMWDGATRAFKTNSVMVEVIENALFNLEQAPINPPETKETYNDGVWLQPFEYADELH